MFSRHSGADADRSSVSVPQAMVALLDAGIIPAAGDLHDRGQDALGDFDRSVRFSEFLAVAEMIRKESVRRVHSGMPNIEQETGSAHADAQKVISELDLLSDCAHSTEELLEIASSRDCRPGSFVKLPPEMDSYVVMLALRVVEYVRATSRDRENQIAKRLGFSWEEVLDLRLTFASLTRTGVLDKDVLKRFLGELVVTSEQEGGEEAGLGDASVSKIMKEVCAAAENETFASTSIGFEGDSLSKGSSVPWRQGASGTQSADESDSASEHGEGEGRPIRVMRFDAYLHLSAVVIGV